MPLTGDRTFKMKMREMENAFRYRRIPYPKRTIEIVTLLAVSCTLFLFFHTNRLNSRIKEMEEKIQPSEFTALGLSGNHLDSRNGQKHNDVNTLQGTYQYLKQTGQLDKLKAHYLNNTRKADIDILFFNRCAKVGSESLIHLFRRLEEFNDLNVVNLGLRKPPMANLPKPRQREEAEDIISFDEGTVYTHHIHWIDFEKLDLPKPIYINLVRDPVERVISWYYYTRGSYKNAIAFNKNPNQPLRSAEWFKKDFNKCVRSGDPECQYVPYTVKGDWPDFKRQSAFFCGHDEDCFPFDSPTAVQMAKEHVERDYAVVGSWEDTNITLTVFEKYIPRFFRGVKEIFEIHIEEITNQNKNKRKPKIDKDVKEMIRKNFTHEYEFYHFCKQRLYKQYIALRLDVI